MNRTARMLAIAGVLAATLPMTAWAPANTAAGVPATSATLVPVDAATGMSLAAAALVPEAGVPATAAALVPEAGVPATAAALVPEDDAAARGPKVREPRAAPGAGGVIFSRHVLDLLGMDRVELRQKLADGQSLAQIAEARGVSRDALKKAMTEAFHQRLEERKARFADNLDRLIDARGGTWFHKEKGRGKAHVFFPGAGKESAETPGPHVGHEHAP